jgi:hypothetical protein
MNLFRWLWRDREEEVCEGGKGDNFVEGIADTLHSK